MATSLSPEIMLYVEIFFTLVFFAAAWLVHAALRRVFIGKKRLNMTPWGRFFAHVSFPAALLAVLLLVKWPLIRNALPVRPLYIQILDSGFIFVVLFFLIRIIDALLEVSFEKKGKPFPLPRVLHGFILLVIYLAAIFAILDQFLNVDIKPLLAGSAILTAVLGLALQGVLGNVLAGMSLHYTKSFSRGDWIKVGESEGMVIDTNWRETRIQDGAKNIIILPNSEVASRTIVNYSLPDSLVEITLPVKVSFNAPPAVVAGKLCEAAREASEVAPSPAPKALILSYDEFGISYILKFHINDYARKDDIRGDVARLAWYKFQRHDIEIPLPLENKVRRVLSTVKPDERIAEVAGANEKNYQDLARSSFLRVQEGEKAGEAVLSAEETGALAGRARRGAFAADEVLFRQGERGDRCYLVASGKVRGEIIYEEDGKKFKTDFEVGQGGIVGEMSLFTGIPRTATVVVSEEAELLEIGAEAFADLLGRNPGLAEAIAEIVSSRNQSNLEMLRKIKELSAGQIEQSSNKKSVLEYLKKLVRIFKR